MSFRRRLTLFFVLIVIVPMVSLTFVLFRLIADNENGKADAQVAARQQAAIRLYDNNRQDADRAALAIGRDVPLATALRAGDRAAADARARQLLRRVKAKRIVVSRGTRVIVDVGAGNAVFPADRRLVDHGGKPFGRLLVSTTGPRAYGTLVRRLTGMHVVLRSHGQVLFSSLPQPPASIPTGTGSVSAGGADYRSVAYTVPGFANQPIQVAMLDSKAATSDDIRRSRLLAAAILAGFFILAFTFAVLVSRSLQRQIQGFLEVARRLGAGDFTAKVPTQGNDEFAALGAEFNQMSGQLEQRLEELRTEQARLADAMRRIGETFAANLDRDGLLEIVVRTALDGVAADGGRATMRRRRDAPLHQVAQAGSLDGLVPALHAAESAVLETGAPYETTTADDVIALAHPLRSVQQGDDDGPPRITGIVSVARAGRPFSDSERELFHYLAAQASVSIENVGLHETVERQAVTDELTGLSNRRRFQETLNTEVERSRRFNQPVSLVMVDIDDFKSVNDRHGHQVGDLVLREVASIIRASLREIDEPARYGGEELAVVLPGTDIDGAYNLAERVRTGIEELDLPVLGGDDKLTVTASLGVATHPLTAADAGELVAAADSALYEAKRSGKNRTVRATEAPLI